MPDWVLIVGVLVATARSATPLVLAGIGELVAERSGVLNLGVEGTMLVGAACGFIGTVLGGPVVGVACAAAAGAGMSLLFAGLTLGLMANQVAAGLALTIFGIGLSALIGFDFQGKPLPGLATMIVPDLASRPPVVQQLLLLDPLVWLAAASAPAVAWLLYRTRAGLVLRAVGESHDVAFALGYSVRRIRLGAVLFGGVMSGLAGASLSLAYTPMWTENMVAGRGWIALALVVFSTWKPMLLLAGALLFGFVTILQFQAEALGLHVSSHLLAMLPYLATVLVLVLISRDAALKEHPVPVREEAIKAIGARSLAIDIYIWLAYRLHSLSKPTAVSWPAIHAQFGAGFRLTRQIKPTFTEALQLALAVYPEARVDIEKDGIVLNPSPPAVPKAEARRLGLT